MWFESKLHAFTICRVFVRPRRAAAVQVYYEQGFI